MTEPLCGATLRHVHGQTACDLTPGHLARDEDHSGWCEQCRTDRGHDDPSDRLTWDRDGEDWTTLPDQQPATQELP